MFAADEVKCKKIRLLFLATGEDIRANAASFHHNVQRVINSLQEKLLSGQPPLKIRDHQHLTYDLFAKAKVTKKAMAINCVAYIHAINLANVIYPCTAQ